MNAQMLLQSFAGGDGDGGENAYIEDVFSTYLYTGNSSTQTINNGIDLAGKGGLVWTKPRTTDSTYGGKHILRDTVRGLGSSAGQGDLTIATSAPSGSAYGYGSYRGGFNSFLSNGFSLKNIESEVSFGSSNTNGVSYASWTFRNAPKFFKCVTVTKSAGSNATVDLSSLGTVGMVTVKRTDYIGNWYTWHRSLSAGQLVYLNQTAAASTLGHITVSGTTLTLVNGVIADGTYVVYAWAHDPSADGVIQCGSFATDGSGNATVNLGWEPQWLLVKPNVAGSTWDLHDDMRGFTVDAVAQPVLYPNLANDESATTVFRKSNTGFSRANAAYTSTAHFYLAIRRPNKPPKTGAEVYSATTSSATVKQTVGFVPDAAFINYRATPINNVTSRLIGKTRALTHSTAAEVATASIFWDEENGYFKQSYDTANINHFFRRAPGFFDVVCDTGTGAAHAINHSLTVAPELIIRKSRSAGTQWEWWHSALTATEKLVLNSTAGKVTDATAFGTLPTATQFYVGTSSNTNASAATYVTYLFATCPGVSMVGYYTGNGTSLTVDCGFSAGARFILAKSIDDAGDWFIWDSARGIVAANDPHLSLNTTAAEVTTDDSVDPYAGGFIVNQNTATNINVNGKRYAYLAIA